VKSLTNERFKKYYTDLPHEIKRQVRIASIRYTDEPMGEVKIINDFRPSSDQLTLKDDNVKITIALKIIR